MADLFLKQRRTGGLIEEKWREVEREELRRAFYTELINRGQPPIEARRHAETLSAGLVRGHARTVVVDKVQAQIEAQPERPKIAAAVIKRPVQPSPKLSSAVNVREQIRSHLETYPESRKLSARKLSELVTGSDRSRQVANEELQIYRTESEDA